MSSYILTTADERINFIRVKVARAYEHIQDLEKRIKSFLDSEPYKVGVRPDPQFPNVKEMTQHYVVSAQPITTDIPLIAGEALQQMRSALDHLAWNLVEVGCMRQSITLSAREQRDISFPIIDTDNPAQYVAARERKVKGMRQAAIDAIDAIKPYKGGNDILWKLHQLNNIDKHRFIVFAGAQLASIALPRFLKRAIFGHAIEHKGIEVPPNVDLGRATLNLNIVPDRQFRKCPLEEGDELVGGFTSFLDHDEEVNFTFEVVFNEPGIVECEAMLPLLMQTLKGVNDLILSFKPLLA